MAKHLTAGAMNGFDRGEFRAGMLSIGLTFDDDTIDAIFRYMDSDDGGSVETAEFIANMESFSALMDESPSSILLNLCKHMDKTGETIKHIFARIGIGSSVSAFFLLRTLRLFLACLSLIVARVLDRSCR